MRAASGFDQAVSHEGARRDNSLHNAGLNQVTEDKAHLADRESTGQSHHDEAILVARHRFEDISGVTNLSGGIGCVAHSPNKLVNGLDFREVERIDRTKFVFDGIVKNASGNSLAGVLSHRVS
jgi:hypothetical protein